MNLAYPQIAVKGESDLLQESPGIARFTDMSQTIATTDFVEGWVPALTWGARLCLIRQQMGWNVQEAAAACNITRTSWQNWEDGKGCRNQEEVAAKISAATDASYVWLLTGQMPQGAATRSRCSSPSTVLRVIDGQKHDDDHSPTTNIGADLRLVKS